MGYREDAESKFIRLEEGVFTTIMLDLRDENVTKTKTQYQGGDVRDAWDFHVWKDEGEGPFRTKKVLRAGFGLLRSIVEAGEKEGIALCKIRRDGKGKDTRYDVFIENFVDPAQTRL